MAYTYTSAPRKRIVERCRICRHNPMGSINPESEEVRKMELRSSRLFHAMNHWLPTRHIGQCVKHLILLTVLVVCCVGAAEHPVLFDWESRFDGGSLDMGHGEYFLAFHPKRTIRKEMVTKEIIQCLTTGDLSESKIVDGALRKGLQERGLRDCDALALALSALSRVRFQLFVFDDVTPKSVARGHQALLTLPIILREGSLYSFRRLLIGIRGVAKLNTSNTMSRRGMESFEAAGQKQNVDSRATEYTISCTVGS